MVRFWLLGGDPIVNAAKLSESVRGQTGRVVGDEAEDAVRGPPSVAEPRSLKVDASEQGKLGLIVIDHLGVQHVLTTALPNFFGKCGEQGMT